MNSLKVIRSMLLNGLILFTVLPVRAGIPVIDTSNLAQAIQQVAAWNQQYNQMILQLNQLTSMKEKLDGARSLGTVLNNPSINSQLPLEMQNTAAMMANPSALSSSAASLSSVMSTFGIAPGAAATTGQGNADLLLKMQAILTAAQVRQTQIGQLATRVDTTADAKESLDLINRNSLENATLNNQVMQTMATIEAGRQQERLRQIASDQVFMAGVKAGGAAPIMNLPY